MRLTPRDPRSPEGEDTDDRHAGPARESIEGFLGLRRQQGDGSQDGDGASWSLELRRELCGPGDRMFGGTGFAATLAVAEQALPTSILTAACQFFGRALAGDHLELGVVPNTAGRRVTTLDVVGRVGERIVIRTAVTGAAATAAAGALGTDDAAASMLPDLPPPEECPPRLLLDPDPALISSRLDVRMARPFRDDGCSLWARLPGVDEGSVALLGLLADHVPVAALIPMEPPRGAATLAIDLRLVSPPTGGWIALTIELDHVDRDAGHGRVRLWSEDGRLLAVSSQTFAVTPAPG